MKTILSILLSAVAGAVLMYSILSLGLLDFLKDYPSSYGLYFLGLLPLLYFFVVGVHELGHVAFGRWQNFDFFGLTVGPLSWRPEPDGRIKFHWNRNLNLAGGVAMMLPNGDEQLAKRFAWFAAGGPIFSLALICVLLAIVPLLPDLSLAEFLTFGCAMLSGLIFVATILPFQSGGFSSDGRRILVFSKGGPEAEVDLVGLQSLAAIRAGSGYDKMPIDRIRQQAESGQIPLQQQLTLAYYDYLYRLSQNDVPGAAEQLNYVMNNLETYPQGLRASFYVEQTIFEAIYCQDLAAAEAAMGKYQKTPLTEQLSLLLAQAGIARLKADNDQLPALLPQIRRQLSNSMDQNRIPIIEGWLNDWEEQLQ